MVLIKREREKQDKLMMQSICYLAKGIYQLVRIYHAYMHGANDFARRALSAASHVGRAGARG
jgi:hypothetical protein